ncbi:flagellar biosynthesis protein FlhB [Herbivorax sp. ANBcel31]|nr:flagellar biosynthesis protein FlhB [Herbivorax sp. ANBcel31]MDQ2085878.1 flagellar biosynthesis protein FlhB [Herbivorax sp. ANBcel31]
MPVNLQKFADSGEKTEKATPKKRKKAREEGQVLQSKEMTSAIVLLCMFITLRISGSYMYEKILEVFKVFYTQSPKMEGLYTLDGILKVFSQAVVAYLKIIIPIFAVAFLTALITMYAQVGFLFTTKTLKFKLSKLNPLSGLKRIFSIRSLTELVKAIFKISVIGLIGFLYLRGEVVNILKTMDMDVISIAAYIGVIGTNVAIRMCIAILILGVFDYMYQWWEYEKKLKMSKHEVKEEHKQSEGNPEIKSKIKQKQKQMSMKRMMQDIPDADVVITNPTHFAVAVKYDAKISDAPFVLAKGQDYIALRIKETAKENGVEIVENKPLARAIFTAVEIGEKVPPELYQAVAEVLAFVYGLKNSERGRK